MVVGQGSGGAFVEYPRLLLGEWVERPHRFMVRVRLLEEDDGGTLPGSAPEGVGSVVEVHSNNSGTMRSCSGPGRRVLVSRLGGEGRKLWYRLHAVEAGGDWVGVDTSTAPALVRAFLDAGGWGGLKGVSFVRREVVVRAGSRLDLEMRRGDGERLYGEVKNVTLFEGGRHMFPDARSERAAKHVEELGEMSKEGMECWVFFVVQRSEGGAFSPADHIDPEFGRALRRAVGAGLNVAALGCVVERAGVRIDRELLVEL